MSLKETSKYMSLILRHKPETINISLDEHGGADVELDESEPPVELWHGTGEKFVASIDEQGLISKSRLYVHLSKDSDTAIKVGKRHGKPVLYIVKAAEMYKDGYKFYLSKNGVWLTREVPVKYLVKQQRFGEK